MINSNIAIDTATCLACGNCADRCIMDNLRLILPPCRQASALGINYQGILRLAAAQKTREAAQELRRYTPFGGILSVWGDNTASRACSRNQSGGALEIRRILQWLHSEQPDILYSLPERLPRSHKKTAVIGSGPAGLMASYALRMGGHDVTIFEAAAQAGITLQNPPAEESGSAASETLAPVPQSILERTLTMLGSMGIQIKTSAPQGQEELHYLCKNFDAVICACGSGAVLPADAFGWVRHNLFAAGTCVKNKKAQNALQAMASGAHTAHAVRNFLEGFDIDYESNEREAKGLERFQGLSDAQAEAQNSSPILPQSNIYSLQEAQQEASRCLGCGRPVERNKTCWYCLPCEVVCPTQALHVRIPYLIR